MVRPAALILAAVYGQLSPEVAMRSTSIRYYLAYEDCLKNKAVVAGVFTTADAREVAKKAQPECEQDWARFRLVLLGGAEPTAASLQELNYFRSLAIGTASAEVVVGRSGSCGTQPGPYQCGSETDGK